MPRFGLPLQAGSRLLKRSIYWTLAFLSLVSHGKAQDPSNKKGEIASKDPLLLILHEESEGKLHDRSRELPKWILLDEKQAIDAGVESAPKLFRWHAGQIEFADTWIAVGDLAPGMQSTDHAKYIKERGDEVLDLESHRKIARWCRNRNLELQARAHWFAVLEQNPSDQEARDALRYVNHDNRWLSPEEIASIQLKAKADYEALKNWIPKVREWVLAIEGQDAKKRIKAIRQLKEVSDPGVLPAIGVAIGNVSPDTALHMIGAIERFHTAEACFLLANLAIADPTSELGVAAIEGLAKYPLGFFVPDFLDMMSSEFQMTHNVSTGGNGALKLQILQVREMRRKYDIDQFQRRFSGSNTSATAVSNVLASRLQTVRNPDPVRESGLVKNQVAKSIAENESLRVAKESQALVDRTNSQIREFQSRLTTVLRAVTKKQLGDEPKPWWEWWDQYEELYVSGEKHMDYSYYEDTSIVYVEAKKTFVLADRFEKYPRMRNTMSCLVAGTPIQTQSGLRPIETIRVGDLVVAQNIESGEIQMRPVLRTTVRPPARTYDIVFENNETIRATLGHRWWIIGKGWIKTKDLQEGMSMRTASGFSTIKSLKQADAAVTYNLLIDQDHTYFVGQTRVLSFDASEAIPTFFKTPGFVPSPLRSE
ncbi:MAG: hypothetical protein RJB11_792 [Planctomycetota bacterium]